MGLQTNKEDATMTDTTTRDLQLHTLAGDIQSIGMDGYSKRGIRNILINRYVRLDTEISTVDFDEVLDEQYAKVEEWRASQKAGGKN
jgi:hypothetical protein